LSQLNFYKPDVFGIQEGMPHQVVYLNEKLEGYQFIGDGRDGSGKGELSAIFYNTKKFEIVQSGTFWLSETPSVTSKGWDAAYPRICSYALFKSNNNEKNFWVFNTHLDHIGNLARQNGIDLILERINNLNTKNYPVIFMGDFNLEPESKPVSKLLNTMNDSKVVSSIKPFGPEGTFNGFNYFEEQTKRIDYVFVSKSIIVKRYAVLNNSYNLKYASDHFPVFVQVLLN